MNNWIDPAANWLLAPVGVVLIGYTAANAAAFWPAVILVAVIAATLSFIHPKRWVLWAVIAALAVPTGHASAAVVGALPEAVSPAASLSALAALFPALAGAVGGRFARRRLDA